MVLRIDLEESESLDLVLASADLRGSPVPDNFVAADDDVVCASVGIWSILEDFVDPLSLRCYPKTIELHVCVSLCTGCGRMPSTLYREF